MIIPFFIPHSGCPHQCVFCNQKKITGQRTSVDPSSVAQTITAYLDKRVQQEPAQVAFYGGSFTALDDRGSEKLSLGMPTVHCLRQDQRDPPLDQT